VTDSLAQTTSDNTLLALGKQKQEVLWGSLASKSDLSGEFQGSERSCLQGMGVVFEGVI
jgi:hypothetical protein